MNQTQGQREALPRQRQSARRNAKREVRNHNVGAILEAVGIAAVILVGIFAVIGKVNSLVHEDPNGMRRQCREAFASKDEKKLMMSLRELGHEEESEHDLGIIGKDANRRYDRVVL